MFRVSEKLPRISKMNLKHFQTHPSENAQYILSLVIDQFWYFHQISIDLVQNTIILGPIVRVGAIFQKNLLEESIRFFFVSW